MLSFSFWTRFRLSVFYHAPLLGDNLSSGESLSQSSTYTIVDFLLIVEPPQKVCGSEGVSVVEEEATRQTHHSTENTRRSPLDPVRGAGAGGGGTFSVLAALLALLGKCCCTREGWVSRMVHC